MSINYSILRCAFFFRELHYFQLYFLYDRLRLKGLDSSGIHTCTRRGQRQKSFLFNFIKFFACLSIHVKRATHRYCYFETVSMYAIWYLFGCFQRQPLYRYIQIASHHHNNHLHHNNLPRPQISTDHQRFLVQLLVVIC